MKFERFGILAVQQQMTKMEGGMLHGVKHDDREFVKEYNISRVRVRACIFYKSLEQLRFYLFT